MNKTNVTLPLILIFCLVALPQISENIYTPALAELSDYFTVGYSHIERTVSLYFCGFALGVLFFGILSDKFGRRTSIIYGLGLYILGSFFCICATNIYLFFLGRIMQGFGASTGSVIVQTMIRDCYEAKERGSIFTQISIYLCLAPAIGPVIGGLLTTYFSWHANFATLILFASYILFWSFRSLPETVHLRRQANHSKANPLLVFKNILTNKKVILSLLIVGTFNGLLFGFYAEGPYIYIDMLGNPPDIYGLMGIIFALCGAIGGIASRKLLSKTLPIFTVKQTALYLFIIAVFLLSIMYYRGFEHILSAICILIMMGALYYSFSIIIPRVLSEALTEFNYALGTASAFFGCLYYVIIYIQIEILALLHNGYIWVFPIFFVILSMLIFLASKMLESVVEKPAC
jgi:Bcr/CflA subfamily drug resistance transporter